MAADGEVEGVRHVTLEEARCVEPPGGVGVLDQEPVAGDLVAHVQLAVPPAGILAGAGSEEGFAVLDTAQPDRFGRSGGQHPDAHVAAQRGRLVVQIER